MPPRRTAAGVAPSAAVLDRLVARLLVLEQAGPDQAVPHDGLAASEDETLAAARERARRRVAQAARAGAATLVTGLAGPDPIAWFEPVAGAPHDSCVVLAEVALRRSAEDAPGVVLREHVLAIAERSGWALAETSVVDGLAAYRRLLMSALQKHRRTLQHEGHDVTAAYTLMQRRLARLAAGAHHHELMRFVRRAASPEALVRVEATRADAMRRLFAAVFGHEMTPEHWQWKYGSGRGAAVALESDGELLAHYGGVRRELRMFGRPALACQVCDVMVRPQANAGIVRRGPLHVVAASFLETQIGFGLPQLVGYGFPNARAYQVAQRLELYDQVDRVLQFSWPAQAAERAAWRAQTGLAAGDDLIPAARRAVDGLWREMAGALRDKVLGVRDARWVRWRYLQRLGMHYELLLLRSRWWRRPLGLLVARVHNGGLEVLDLIAPPARFGLLVAAARAHAAAAGLAEVRCWITASQRAALQDIDPTRAQVADLGILVPTSVHGPGPDPELLRDRWFLLAGDADFT